MGGYILAAIGGVLLLMGIILFVRAMMLRYTDKDRIKKPRISTTSAIQYIIISIGISVISAFVLGLIVLFIQILIGTPGYMLYNCIEAMAGFLFLVFATRIVIVIGDLDRIGEKPDLRPVYHPKRILRTCIWILVILTIYNISSLWSSLLALNARMW